MSWLDDYNFYNVPDECEISCRFFESTKGEKYAKAINIINNELKEVLSIINNNVNRCINRIEKYAKEGLKSELIRSVNNLPLIFQLVLRKVYYRIRRRLWDLGFTTPEIIFMILERLMKWISGIIDRVRGIIEAYKDKLGIKDFSISMSISGPFVQVTFGVSITFSL